jgi:glutamyl-tRNA synthetase
MFLGVVKITKVDGGLEGELIPDGDFKKAKRKISWLAKPSNPLIVTLYEFDNLVSKEKLEEDDEFENFVNEHTLATSEVIGDAGLKTLQHGEIIQLERRGYYRVDKPHFNDGSRLVLYMVPDGKSKSMSGLSGKLAHR